MNMVLKVVRWLNVSLRSEYRPTQVAPASTSFLTVPPVEGGQMKCRRCSKMSEPIPFGYCRKCAKELGAKFIDEEVTMIKCSHCRYDISIRNPSGYCTHLEKQSPSE